VICLLACCNEGFEALTVHGDNDVHKVSLPVKGASKEIPLRGFGTCCRRSASGPSLVASIKGYLAMGGRHIDTAVFYGNQKDVGAAIRESAVPRDELWVTSKILTGFGGVKKDHTGHAVNEAKTAEDVQQQVDMTLKELGVDYVDLMLLHRPSDDGDEGNAKLWQALIGAQKAGKVRNIGVSQHDIRGIKSLETRTGVLPSVNQIEYHPWVPGQRELVKWCQERNIVVTAFNTIKGAARHKDAVSKIAAMHGASNAQVLIQWALDQNVVVIPGATSEDHIRENFHTGDFHIEVDEF
jgi:diketogulonate reductase-like aldo/keto reductase